MKDKILNLALFLLEEFEKQEVEEIKAEFLKKGIDLEMEKQKLLDQIKQHKARLKKEKAQKFKNSYADFLSKLGNLTGDELKNSEELAIQFRRNSKNAVYKLTDEDRKKLKFISDYRRTMKHEESEKNIENTKRNS